MVEDKGKMKTEWTILKFNGDYKSLEDALKKKAEPYEVIKIDGNLLLNEGINTLWTLVCGGSATNFSNGNAYIGVGDSNAAESATQTGLQGTNKAYKGMDSGYPTYGSAQKATWQATFGSNEANFTWNEITVANGNSDSAMNLNRKVRSMGTKASGTTWVVQVSITLS